MTKTEIIIMGDNDQPNDRLVEPVTLEDSIGDQPIIVLTGDEHTGYQREGCLLVPQKEPTNETLVVTAQDYRAQQVRQEQEATIKQVTEELLPKPNKHYRK